MQLAIHDREHSFSDRWITYCDQHDISYIRVNCLDNDIIQKLRIVDALLWHWDHNDPRGLFMARYVLMAAEAMGIVIFPNMPTCWHFDDKVAQKYLLEAIGAPLIPTYIFYDLEDALQWIGGTSFPKVFKLRRGAGSSNVHLVRTRDEARALAKQAFSRGFNPIAKYSNDVTKRYRAACRRGDLLRVLRRVPQILMKIRRINQAMGREKDYLYFQDFVPGNQFDTRVTIIGDRAFAFIRKVRPGDFRASGSGVIDYDVQKIHLECVQSAFEIAQKVGSQSMAFDFVVMPDGHAVIAEVSYCYLNTAVYNCEGYWDHKLNWHPGHVWPEEAILMDLLDITSKRESSCYSTSKTQHKTSAIIS